MRSKRGRLRLLTRGSGPVPFPRAGRLRAELRQFRTWQIQRVSDGTQPALYFGIDVYVQLHLSEPEVDGTGHREFEPRRNRLQPIPARKRLRRRGVCVKASRSRLRDLQPAVRARPEIRIG